MVIKGSSKRAAAIAAAMAVMMCGALTASAETLIEEESTETETEANAVADAVCPWGLFAARDYIDFREQAKVVYDYGSHKEILDWSRIGEWTTIEDDLSMTIDRDAVMDYVLELDEKYTTRKKDRKFKTTDGRTVTIEAKRNHYAYTVDTEEEFPLLMQEIKNGKIVEREPVYIKRNVSEKSPLCFQREGEDDLAGSYVEVDLTNQHLWLYRDGELIIDTPVVTGCVANGKETWTGCYPITYRQKNAVLRGEGYEQPVSYWMPFYDGQGLHDANWRSQFGGTIYQYSGSHGCVNLPPEAAEVIFENTVSGMAVVLYK